MPPKNKEKKFSQNLRVVYIMLLYTSMLNLSWTTIVVHSRDNQEVGMAHEVKSPENHPQFS